jgi:heat shock protein HslJ
MSRRTSAPDTAALVLASAVLLASCYRPGLDHLDAEYVLDGRRIRLVDGVSEIEAAPGSAASIVTRYFGNELRKDLDGDGREDVVFVVTQETGGTGTFYYVVAALALEDGYRGSQGLMLGDRIAPQTTESGRDRIVIVNYADRAPGDSFSAEPSIAKSIWLLLDTESMQFGEVAQDFAGEADPARMRLDMKTWTWIRATYSDGREITPRQEGRFTVTLSADGAFAATTDCNTMRGTYTASGPAVTFGAIAATRMYCADSQEGEFAAVLEGARTYRFTSQGELILELEGGSAVLR